MTIRSVLVLGGGSDIAAAIVTELASNGLQRVVLEARRPDEAAASVSAAVGVATVEVVAERWDATEVATHAEHFAATFDRHGPFDLVVCAVGMLGHHAGRGMGPIEIGEMVQTNFSGPAAALSVVADHLVLTGTASTIVVLSSIAGVRARRSNYVYGSTKAGLEAFAQGLGDALVGTAVRVMVVRPGFVRSKMTTGLTPAPFAATPDDVATALTRALSKKAQHQVWVPALLGPMMAVLRNVPRPVWRKVSGDR